MLTNTCHTIHFLVNTIGTTTPQLATLTSVMDTLNAFGNDFYNSLRGAGPVNPITTLMPDGTTPSDRALPRIKALLVSFANNQQAVFSNVLVGNCFGSTQAFVPDTTFYGVPAWVGTVAGSGIVNLPKEVNLLYNEVYPVYDSCWKTLGNSLNASVVAINNSITTPLKISDRAVPSTTVEVPYNTVGRLLEVNETLWNALPDGDVNTAGTTKYNVMGRILLQGLNHSSALVGGAVSLFNTASTSRKLSSKDLADMQVLWSKTKLASYYLSSEFGKAIKL